MTTPATAPAASALGTSPETSAIPVASALVTSAVASAVATRAATAATDATSGPTPTGAVDGAAVDVRLVPAALAAWAAAAVGVAATARVAAWSGAAVLVVAALVLLARSRSAPRHAGAPGDPAPGGRGPEGSAPDGAGPEGSGPDGAGPGGPAPDGPVRRDVPGRPGTGQAVLALGVVGVLLLTLAAQVRARESGYLRALAEDGARVRVTGVVRSTPQPVGERPAADDEPARPPRTVRFLLAAESVAMPSGSGPSTAPPTTGAATVAGPAESSGGAATDHGTTPGSTSPSGAVVATGAAVEVYAPGSAAGIAYGSRVEVVARLSPARDPAGRAVVRARATEGVVLRAPPAAVLRVADDLRAGLRATAAGLPGDAGRLLPGVVVGDTRDLGDLAEPMRVAGLTHLTAVSGLHFSLVGGVALAGTRWCGVPRRWRWLPVGAVMLGFVVLVQPGASVVRAAVMGAVGLLGLVAGRPARSVPALAVTVVVLLVVDPWLARDVGFVLSVVATAGITLLAGPLTRRWTAPVRGADGRGRDARSVLVSALAVPVAAQVVCAPVILVLRPEVPTYGVLANVLVAPVVAPATLGGLLAVLLGPWWPAAAALGAQVAGAACWWVAAVARTTAAAPGAQVLWADGWLGVLLLAIAGAALLVLVLRRRSDVAP